MTRRRRVGREKRGIGGGGIDNYDDSEIDNYDDFHYFGDLFE